MVGKKLRAGVSALVAALAVGVAQYYLDDERTELERDRIRFVLNRANTKVGLSKREVESALKVSIAVIASSRRENDSASSVISSARNSGASC